MPVAIMHVAATTLEATKLVAIKLVATTLSFYEIKKEPVIHRTNVVLCNYILTSIPGLYRLCGSASKKRILREAFERNARTVELAPDSVPDINVITGLLKDYLRELPQPLFSRCLYQMTVDALGE